MHILISYLVIMMIVQIFVHLLLCAFVLGAPAVPDEIDKGNLTRIIDGQPTSKVNYYEVAIIADNVSPGLICTGAILNSRWIITSAYCVDRNANLRIEYGKNTIAADGNLGQLVYRKYIHPSYNRANLINDLALLEMDPGFPGDASYTSVVLPTNTLDNYVGQTGTVSGWGAYDQFGLTSNTLMSKTVQIINNDYCQKEGNYMIPYKLCTAGRSVCEGDQGAPLVVGNTLVGIASLGLNALTCNSLTSVPFTRINYYLGWIRQVTQNPGNNCNYWNCNGK